jgi:hypothetical protein
LRIVRGYPRPFGRESGQRGRTATHGATLKIRCIGLEEESCGVEEDAQAFRGSNPLPRTILVTHTIKDIVRNCKLITRITHAGCLYDRGKRRDLLLRRELGT